MAACTRAGGVTDTINQVYGNSPDGGYLKVRYIPICFPFLSQSNIYSSLNNLFSQKHYSPNSDSFYP